MKIVYKTEVKKCTLKNGDVSFTFKDLEEPFIVNKIQFFISGYLDGMDFTVIQIYGNIKTESKYLLKAFSGDYDVDFVVEKNTKIIVHNVPFKEKIELYLYRKDKIDIDIESKLSGRIINNNIKLKELLEIPNKIEPFFMVFADKPNQANKIPTVKHITEQEAEAEAIRIADKEKCEVYVFKAVKKVSLIPSVQTIK